MDKLLKLYSIIFKDRASNIPAMFFFYLGLFGIIVILSGFITDFLKLPFILIATVASFFAMWYLDILGSLVKHVNKLETTVDELKSNNDRLHSELMAFETLRGNLERYAEETKSDFGEILREMNSSFSRLEELTKSSERVLIARVAQDLEFMDREEGMSEDEYKRFVSRIPNNLKSRFEELGYNSFERVAGDDNIVDYKEIRAIVNSLT